ncbi:glycosyltransferase family 39 protein [Patescibacteria group bacterium]|nr:glycosyltransferase family 39 protein [Patescibacteria group bacterium]
MFDSIRKIKKEYLFLFFILALAIFLRFFNLKNTFMFQGDQGRDALVVSQIFKEKDPVFIGPVTSIGNMYLGPFYYYFMLPFLFLSYPNPIGPVYAVAGLSVLTVFLLFKITKKLFNKKTAYISTIFFTLSAGVVNLARFSWNPNIAPFFSLLMFYFTFQAWKKNTKYWLLVSLCFSLLIQLHYVTLLSLSGAGIVFLIQLIAKIKNNKKHFFVEEKRFFKHVALAILIFIISLTPLMLFDYKHDFTNAKSFTKILVKEESFDLQRKKGREGFGAITKFVTIDLKNRASQILFEPSFAANKINYPLLYLLLLSSVFYLVKNKNKIKDSEIVLLAYLLPGIIGISLYQHEVYEHYIAYLFPFVYILYGLFFAKFKNKWLMLAIILPFLAFFISSNISRYSIKDAGWKPGDMSKTSDEIYRRVNKDEKYNIVLFSPSKDSYGMSYRYFLSTKENKIVELEDHQLATKLFIINDEKEVRNDIFDTSLYEVVVFPSRTIDEVFQMENGPEISVLTSYNK